MKTVKPLSRRLAGWVFFFMFLAILAVDGGVYWVLNLVTPKVQLLAQNNPSIAQADTLLQLAEKARNLFWPYFVPASALFFGLLALMLSSAVSRSVRKRIGLLTGEKPVKDKSKKGSKAAKFDKLDKLDKAGQTQSDMGVQQRMYLHLMTVLQREGRLMDFFSEDLTKFPDAQIGAAVRNIHENCMKIIKKYLSPHCVVDQKEGEQITVEKDFDPNALKLVGNVIGEPPFTGVVRHKGWRAGKIELPAFSGQQDPSIIAPAEIEVQGK
ncbi:MAG: DUF2760 domain-containing protein [Desulfobacteraceae bacterium]|nr:DUF2760 domain-containing protein [Desulfobacteraceae bacterium]